MLTGPHRSGWDCLGHTHSQLQEKNQKTCQKKMNMFEFDQFKSSIVLYIVYEESYWLLKVMCHFFQRRQKETKQSMFTIACDSIGIQDISKTTPTGASHCIQAEVVTDISITVNSSNFIYKGLSKIKTIVHPYFGN